MFLCQHKLRNNILSSWGFKQVLLLRIFNGKKCKEGYDYNLSEQGIQFPR